MDPSAAEQPVKRPRGRPRKRKRPEDEIALDVETKRPDRETKPVALVGRYVLKEFKGDGGFIGKVVYYDSGLYRVDYEDGDCEDLYSSELWNIILQDTDFDKELSERRKKLDKSVLKKRDTKKKIDIESKKDDIVDGVEMSRLSDVSDGGQVEDDADSSSSCEHEEEKNVGMEQEATVAPPPQLPPSSGTIGVAEEYVLNLFSVYGFLRSFSVRLFLYPFGLDEFVGSLNCHVTNTLLDSIHVALLHALRRHLEILSSEGSELATKCLRCIEWSLLDTQTWPVYLIHYFTVKGYIKGPEWHGFCDNVRVSEYYTLPAGRKLMILQILCDDILEYVEVRAEIDKRQESEVGVDPNAVINPLENGPKRVHPRYSKTSACKEREAMEIISESQGMKASATSSSLVFSDEAAATDVCEDGNNDECQLCGMDGVLLCCDGCPSAYHSRCIGVVKLHIPDGPWYCPECTIQKKGSPITRGTSLRGADIFGTDVYGQVFLGTCSHLMVLKASMDMEPCVRYYNSNDIPKVLDTLSSSVQHMALYSGTCKAIQQYWDIPESVFCPKAKEVMEAENASGLNDNNVDTVAVSCTEISDANEVKTSPVPWRNADGNHQINMKSAAEPKMEFTLYASSITSQVQPSDSSFQSSVDRSSVMGTSMNSNGSCNGHTTDICLPANPSSQNQHGNRFGRVDGSLPDIYEGSSFKPCAYVNHYLQGDFAASAAGVLASLSSEELPEAQRQSNAHNFKGVAANIQLQAKAFSLAVSRFFWPTSQRKLVEVPRERCSWCCTCKATVSSKRGCMLNYSASYAVKSAMKIMDGLYVRSGDGNIASIAKYILYLEEVLRGLVSGPFLSASHRKEWQKRVQESTTCSKLKGPLLELEENISNISLSGEWLKVIDDWFSASSMIQSASSGTAQKRAPSGKRQKKQSGAYEATGDGCDDKSFCWWGGGNLSVLVFQKAILPCSMVIKASRQGGVKKIRGIGYSDESEVPKRSKQLVWRAAVERSANASQLALQVRHLDHHVRWGDLVFPDQNTLDFKGPETEVSAFRNARIRDKKIVDNKTRYGVAFGIEKHLPSRVMKSVIEIEKSQDGNDKYWFLETRIPLYLIKMYEQSVNKGILPLANKKPSIELSDLQRKQLKASRKDIFSHLASKRDNMEKCFCASCQQDVLLGGAVKCSACQGYCHKDCTLKSAYTSTCKQCYRARFNPQVVFSTESPTSPLLMNRRENHNAATVPRVAQLKNYNQPLASTKSQERIIPEINHAASDSRRSAKSQKICFSKSKERIIPEINHAASDSRRSAKSQKICFSKSKERVAAKINPAVVGSSRRSGKSRKNTSWGVIWKKKNCDIENDIKRVYIHLKGDPEGGSPLCCLCEKPYDSDLMYICCETCQKWYHADAVELHENKLPDVMGFKCCKCRRIRGPLCPYMKEGLKQKKVRMRAEKDGIGNVLTESDSQRVEYYSTPPYSTPPDSSMEDMFIYENDPLLMSVEQVNNSDLNVDRNANLGTGLQKLPVRRHGKSEVDGNNNLFHDEVSTSVETNSVLNFNEEESIPCAQWDVSAEAADLSFEEFNFEDMEFEPQTYFSFTELLSSDELDVNNNTGDDMSINWENVPQENVPLNDQPVNNEVPISCNMCLRTEPAPSLCCQLCGLSIHDYCSQWDESTPREGGWRCGQCREWK